MITLSQADLRQGNKELLKGADLVVHPGHKIGLIGANGCGKTSLFKLLLGELSLEGGDLSIPAQWTIAHMVQEVSESQRSALDYVLDGDQQLRRCEGEIERASAAGDDHRLAALYEQLDNIKGFDAAYRAEQLLHGLGFA